jgi:hypothetical protein
MATEVLINNDGQTEDGYAACGEECAVLVMTWLGVAFDDADPDGGTVDLGDGVSLDCVPLGEKDADSHCAGCGDFIKHGLSCDCPVIYGEKKDPEPLGRPHINFAANA